MGETKIDVLMRVSDTNLARARKRHNEGENDSAVFHASLAVESAANAMILALGGDEAKDHRAISALAAVIRRTKPELLRETKITDLVEKGREIQREVVYSRYPIRINGKWVAPVDYYTKVRSIEIVNTAEMIVSRIKKYLGKKCRNASGV